MQREIKFRAWDKEHKKLVYSDEFSHLGYGNGKEGRARKLSQFFDCYFDKVQQFTYLKDKNGKEIYEGDIVKNEGDGYKEYWRVYFNKERLSWYVGSDTKESFFDDFLYEFCQGGKTYLEVVGNTFETPELLTQNV